MFLPISLNTYAVWARVPTSFWDAERGSSYANVADMRAKKPPRAKPVLGASVLIFVLSETAMETLALLASQIHSPAPPDMTTFRGQLSIAYPNIFWYRIICAISSRSDGVVPAGSGS
jgi:hypothetical protein